MKKNFFVKKKNEEGSVLGKNLMKKMRFDIENVKRCLVMKRKVFTVRSYWLKNEDVYVSGVGICRRIRGYEIVKKEDLVKFMKLSGFENVEDWWNVIERMYGNKRKFVYCVKVIEKNEESDKSR